MRVRIITFRRSGVRPCLWLVLLSFLWLSVMLRLTTAGCLASTAGGVTVAPANVTLDIQKGKPGPSETVSVRNDYAESVTFSVAVQGQQITTDGSLAPSGALEPAMAGLLAATPEGFSLAPQQSINLKITVKDAARLAPGGHYASLLIRQSAAEGQKGLALSSAVSVSVFVIKEDGAVRSVGAGAVHALGRVAQLPSAATVDFQNLGNVAVVPRASAKIYDPRGHLVMAGVINQESVPITPGKTARLQAPLTPVGYSWLPGRYTLRVLYRYDGTDQQKTVSATLLVVPVAFIASTILLVLVGVVVYRLARLRAQSRLLRSTAHLTQPASASSQKFMDVIVRPRKK